MSNPHITTDDEGTRHYEWIFDNHRFMIWFGDEPGWIFVTDCDKEVMTCRELDDATTAKMVRDILSMVIKK